MLSRSQNLILRLTTSVMESASSPMDALRALSTSSACLRRLHDPLPPTPPPGALEGIQKPDLVDKYLSLETGSRSERTAATLQQVREQFQRFPGDTGSSEVQVALLTAKIASLAEHLAQHKKDHNSRRGLRAMLAKRRSLLQYLRRTEFDAYASLISRLGLKDTYGPQDRFTLRYKAATPKAAARTAS